MSDLVGLVEVIMRYFKNRPEPRRTAVLGAEYEERERRRSIFWVSAILIILFLSGWLVWRWMMSW